MMKRYVVTFDLRRHAASYQFLQFLINAELLKPKDRQLVIKIRMAPLRVRQQGRSLNDSILLLEHVMRPAVSLIGAELAADEETGPAAPSQDFIECVIAAQNGIPIPKWKVPERDMERAAAWLKGRNPVVITLRECGHWPARNSNLKAWMEFARNCGEDVVFIRDTALADEPLEGFETSPLASRDLLFRAALMMHAKANLMVANGPIMICYYSDVPFLCFRQLCPEHPEWGAGRPEFWARNGLAVGDQFPWSGPAQRLTWCDDRLENIEMEWELVSKFCLRRAA